MGWEAVSGGGLSRGTAVVENLPGSDVTSPPRSGSLIAELSNTVPPPTPDQGIQVIFLKIC